MNVDIINNPDFRTTVFYLLGYGLIAWFMGWGISFITSLFIKIIQKGV